MNFLEQARLGKNNAFSYIATMALLFATVIGFGQLPYVFGLLGAGVPIDKIDEFDSTEGMQLLGTNLFLTLQLIPFIMLLLALLFCLARLHQRPILSIFTARTSFDLKRVFVSFAIWFGLLLLLLLISVGFGADITWNLKPSTFWMLLAISLFILPLQTTFEEVFFRGYLIQGFQLPFKRGIISILVSSFLFGILHMANPEVALLGKVVLLYYILTGIFVGILTVMDNGLELGIGFHAANNIFGCLILTNNWQVFQTDAVWKDMSAPSIGWDIWITLFVVYPFLLVLYSKIYKWKSFKSVLLEVHK